MERNVSGKEKSSKRSVYEKIERERSWTDWHQRSIINSHNIREKCVCMCPCFSTFLQCCVHIYYIWTIAPSPSDSLKYEDVSSLLSMCLGLLSFCPSKWIQHSLGNIKGSFHHYIFPSKESIIYFSWCVTYCQDTCCFKLKNMSRIIIHFFEHYEVTMFPTL